ncbi:flagellar hook protein FlgE [uncultured Rhodospira sp.]|uniref:flagellar hook protein FlgE n=1 Tax=uncultured Rhodospira sp. TaxID=1936189 RepID=UPI0026275DDB|nr:flagellar hook-basal body complex protein [uncultured Rhodospira sp.]
MSVFAALHTSAQGMTTQSHVMERISGNVSNVNTVGYKSFDAHLQDTVNHVTTTGTFVGVNSVDIRRMDQQGIITSTGDALDMAINGNGFFVTNPKFDLSDTTHYTRNGATGTRLGDDGNSYLTTSAGDFILGWAADEEGAVDTTGPLVPIQVDSVDPLAGSVTDDVTFAANVEANSTQAHNFEVRVWSTPDAEGNNDPYALVMTWSPGEIGSNAWTVSYSVRGPDGNTTALPETTDVTFDGFAKYQSPEENPVVTVPFADGTSSDITIDLTGMTQYGDSGFSEIYQEANGFSDGFVSSVGFDNFGRLMTNYSNGQNRVQYQVALADFTAPQNLEDAGNTAFTYRAEAGELTLFGVGDVFDSTAILPSAVEGSTVDLAKEFSLLITTQRAYSTSATVYRTSDEMLRTATQLK